MTNPAKTYETYMVPVLFAPWASRLIQSANLQSTDRVLDVGCGTGIVARIVSETNVQGKIIGFDLNPNMLAVAREMADRKGQKIEWYEGRVESMPFPDSSFDLVLCQEALQFFADRKMALSEIHRVLTPGGRFVLSVWQGLDRHPFYEKLHNVIQKRFGMSGVETIFELGDPVTVHSLLTSAGFSKVRIEPVTMTARFPDPSGFLAGEIDVDTAAIPSMQHLDAKERQRITSDLRDEMDPALREVTENDHVVLQFHANIVSSIRP